MVGAVSLREVIDRVWERLGAIESADVYPRLGEYVCDIAAATHDTDCLDDEKDRMTRHLGDIQETLREASWARKEGNLIKEAAHLRVVVAMLGTFQFFYAPAEESPNEATRKIDAYVAALANGIRLLMQWRSEVS